LRICLHLQLLLDTIPSKHPTKKRVQLGLYVQEHIIDPRAMKAVLAICKNYSVTFENGLCPHCASAADRIQIHHVVDIDRQDIDDDAHLHQRDHPLCKSWVDNYNNSRFA
jgi:hypothetical protein